LSSRSTLLVWPRPDVVAHVLPNELEDDFIRINGHLESGARVENAPGAAKDLLLAKNDAKRKT
jgi:hypothetical protein